VTNARLSRGLAHVSAAHKAAARAKVVDFIFGRGNDLLIDSRLLVW